jgi:hypothetical protein
LEKKNNIIKLIGMRTEEKKIKKDKEYPTIDESYITK